jgi:tRNA (uracil-5-)-methyltransferase TRM9
VGIVGATTVSPQETNISPSPHVLQSKMKPQTAEKLNQINQKFYQKIAAEFDSSRHYHWPGWEILWEKINLVVNNTDNKTIKILDLGCGNARFYDFLEQKLPDDNFQYYGLDFSSSLLEIAKNNHTQENFHILEADIFNDNWLSQINTSQFDLIVLFGVMHHIPSPEKRQRLFQSINNILSNTGKFVFTTWQFLSSPRLANKVIDGAAIEGEIIFNKLSLNPQDLSSGDYILDWNKGQKAYRYGHIYQEKEIQDLTFESELKIQETFTADGKEGNVNRYYIVQKSL